MHGEVTFDHLDRMIEAYAAASIYVSELRELETRIARATADLLRHPASFADLTALLASRSVGREAITRRVAWASQHILGKRAWIVGSKLLVKLPFADNAYGSPMLDQMRLLGFVSVGEKALAARAQSPASPSGLDGREPVAEIEPDFEIPPLDKLDAVLASPDSDEVWVVKGCSYSQALRMSPELWVNADRDGLFGQDDRFMACLVVPAAHVRTLLASRDLLQTAYPQLKVRACFLVINDPGCSWHFQAHDLSPATPDVVSGARVRLDKFEVLATHRAFPDHFAKDAFEFASLPDWAGSEPLSALPADRPTRSLLTLQELWARQLARPRRLATARADDLAEAVARNHSISLGRDQWRHDLEDCLERGGFVRRLPDRPGRFAITPRGVGRVIVLRRKLGALPDLTPAQLLNHVSHQARLWASAPVA
jgi:hypothetical protein